MDLYSTSSRSRRTMRMNSFSFFQICPWHNFMRFCESGADTGRAIFWRRNLPLLIFASRETAVAGRYFFFAAADLAATAALFCALALLALDCFCEDFFWLDFGDLSPIILFFRGLTGLRNFSFSAAEGHHARLGRHCKQPLRNHFGPPISGRARNRRGRRPKDICRYLLLSRRKQRCCLRLLDS
jgi:hypothetical protein